MGFGVWSALLAAGVLGGSLTCASLFVRTPWIPVTGAGATLATISTVLLVWAISIASGRVDATIASGFLALGAGAGGFALAAALVAPVTRREAAFRLPADLADDDGTVRVILLADCEPESYDPGAVTRVLDEFDAAEAPMPPEPARPLIYAAERARYRRSGRSPSRAAVREIAARLETRLAQAGHAATVTAAFCSGSDGLASVLAERAAAGARRFAVVPLTVAWTAHFEEALEPLRGRDVAGAGVRIDVADPLSSSDGITGGIASAVTAAAAPGIGETGVCLVSPGMPEEVQARSRQESEQTTFFVQRVRAALIERGFSGDLVRQCWMEWQDPDVAEATRHLGAMGAHAIALVPVTSPVETLDTVLELEFVAERAREETGARVLVLPAWGQEVEAVGALAERAAAAMRRLSEDA